MSKIEFVKTDVLHQAYEDSGPRKGAPVLLVHGWPDSPRCWDEVLPALHSAGYRTIVPYLRGFAPTEFRTHLLGRNPKHTAQGVALAQDMIELADALKLRQFDYIGHDWGARAGYALAALYPQRLRTLTAMSVAFHPGPFRVTSLEQAKAYWYQFFLCNDVGAKKFLDDPTEFCKLMWKTWTPERATAKWFEGNDFNAASRSWQGKEFLQVSLHGYRVRWGAADPDPRYDVLQDRYDSTPFLTVPTLLLQGMEDQCVLPESTDGAGRFFTGGYKRVLMDEVGHFIPREAPELTAKEILLHLQGATR